MSRRRLLSLVCCLTLCPSLLRADIYQLKDGGEVVGTTVERTDDGVFTVRTGEGAEVKLQRSLIQRIVTQTEAALEYDRRSRKAPDTAEAHRELAAWCRENKLIAEADHHLARVAQLDPTDEQALQSLGYRRVGNRWLSSDELMAERGMVFYEGKWRTQQDVAIRERDKQAQNTNVDWFQSIRLWRGWLDNRRSERVAEAEALLRAINDPEAAPALAKILDGENDRDVFDLLLDVLGPLDHPVAVQTLVAYTLDPSIKGDVRDECLDYLIHRNRPVQILPYVQALKSKDNLVVNRAGYALGRIGDEAAISPLIDALVTKHKYQIDMGPEMTASASGGLSVGGGGIKIIEKEEQNERVLNALVKLSGNQNFEYDEPAWRAWFVDRQMRQQYNSRRDN
jgi:PBS lyase HEAT-like repeat